MKGYCVIMYMLMYRLISDQLQLFDICEFFSFLCKSASQKKMKPISVQLLNFNFQFYFLNLGFGTNYCYYNYAV